MKILEEETLMRSCINQHDVIFLPNSSKKGH